MYIFFSTNNQINPYSWSACWEQQCCSTDSTSRDTSVSAMMERNLLSGLCWMLSRSTDRLSRLVCSGSVSFSMKCWPARSEHKLWRELIRRVSWMRILEVAVELVAERATLHLMARLTTPRASLETPTREVTKKRCGFSL